MWQHKTFTSNRNDLLRPSSVEAEQAESQGSIEALRAQIEALAAVTENDPQTESPAEDPQSAVIDVPEDSGGRQTSPTSTPPPRRHAVFPEIADESRFILKSQDGFEFGIDGWLDVVTVNEAGVHQLYLGSGGSGFALAPEQIVSDGMRHGILAEFNDDTSLDLIMVGRDANVLEIHANNGIGRLGLGDRVAPALRLVRAASITVPAGEAYADQGATADDDSDGDITDLIETSGAIDPNAVGKQTISYRVADRAGNISSAVRTVNVGVNSGGGGGGMTTPAFIIALSIFLMLRRRRSRTG
jgi:hypothetical protein